MNKNRSKRVQTIQASMVKSVGSFNKFTLEKNFEKKCRLLLDLFKLQIVFAGVFYD
jgi:hypothetical protein